MARKLLSISADAKTSKGEKLGVLTGILYLAPHTLAGRGNLCPDASPDCIALCLNTAGRGQFNSVQQGRIRRTREFFADRKAFVVALMQEIRALVRKAEREGLTPAVRLNGTSDIGWESMPVPACEVCARPFVLLSGDAEGCPVHGIRGAVRSIMHAFPEVAFYDYTKSPARMRRFLEGRAPRNYHLTFSRSECNEPSALDMLARGGNVAVVFSTKRGEALPAAWNGYRVIDGDESDARFLDPRNNPHTDQGLGAIGYVIGLRAKGRARRKVGGFVVQA